MYIGQIVRFHLPCGWVDAPIQWFDAATCKLAIQGVGMRFVPIAKLRIAA